MQTKIENSVLCLSLMFCTYSLGKNDLKIYNKYPLSEKKFQLYFITPNSNDDFLIPFQFALIRYFLVACHSYLFST